MAIPIYAIPAIVALIVKGVIYLYVHLAGMRSLQTRLYVLFLLSLSIQNAAEVIIIVQAAKGFTYAPAGFLYFAASIAAIPLLIHIALELALDWSKRPYAPLYTPFLYAPAVILELLLLFTPWLVQGFEQADYTYTRIPGPLYILFEFHIIAPFIAVLALLYYGGKTQNTSTKRLKNKCMFIGLAPFALIPIIVIVLQRFDIRWFNTTVTLPIALTFFLVVTAYAIYQHRLFDIQFYIPWSKVRQHKTAFYKRIHNMIREIADLDSVNAVMEKLADTLNCPVALVTTNKPPLAVAGGARYMTQIPRNLLSPIDQIVVAHEISEHQPETCHAMQHHGVAAIVPFYPHSQTASGWLLLGDSFTNTVYSRLDFRMVEQLFDKMADLFLDKLLTMRTQLAETAREARALRKDQSELLSINAQLTRENELLKTRNLQLNNEQVADSLIGPTTHNAERLFSGTVILLGRDKAMLKQLRSHYPQTARYVGPGSNSFKKQSAADVLVLYIDETIYTHPEAGLKLIEQSKHHCAFLLYGPYAQRFLHEYYENVSEVLIEVIPDTIKDEALARKVAALNALRNASVSLLSADTPLITRNPQYGHILNQLKTRAPFNEPALLCGNSIREARALAHFIYTLARPNRGCLRILSLAGHSHETLKQRVDQVLEDGEDGVFLDGDGVDSQTLETIICYCKQNHDQHYWMVYSDSHEDMSSILGGTDQYSIPTLSQRSEDLPLLVHFFTMQFNLRTGGLGYLSKQDVDRLSDTIETLETLRSSVFTQLSNKGTNEIVSPPAPEIANELNNKSLDEYVAEYEAGIIKQTLERCGGNKSRAARMLGLRPNTLHYKLERYGLSTPKKKKKSGE